MKFKLATAAILVIAFSLYGLGLTASSLVLIGLGGAAELWFWVRALRGDRSAGPQALKRGTGTAV